MANRKETGSISLTKEMWEAFDAMQPKLGVHSRGAVIEYLITKGEALALEQLEEKNRELLRQLEQSEERNRVLNNKLHVINERFIDYMERTAQGGVVEDTTRRTSQTEDVPFEAELEEDETTLVLSNSIKNQLLK